MRSSFCEEHDEWNDDGGGGGCGQGKKAEIDGGMEVTYFSHAYRDHCSVEFEIVESETSD